MEFSQPVPELPVKDLVEAQSYYRDHLGFSIAWTNLDGRIGAVSHGETAIFLREIEGDVHPSTLWVFAEDLDKSYRDFTDLGARITDPIAEKPWGLRQFTLEDLNGHRFHFHHDL